MNYKLCSYQNQLIKKYLQFHITSPMKPLNKNPQKQRMNIELNQIRTFSHLPLQAAFSMTSEKPNTNASSLSNPWKSKCPRISTLKTYKKLSWGKWTCLTSQDSLIWKTNLFEVLFHLSKHLLIFSRLKDSSDTKSKNSTPENKLCKQKNSKLNTWGETSLNQRSNLPETITQFYFSQVFEASSVSQKNKNRKFSSLSQNILI